MTCPRADSCMQCFTCSFDAESHLQAVSVAPLVGVVQIRTGPHTSVHTQAMASFPRWPQLRSQLIQANTVQIERIDMRTQC
eukprot:5700466-Amphidinium_carterae.3